MSDLIYNLFFVVRWLFYLVRRVLSIVYALLEFIGKPGSRIIVPVALFALAYACRAYLHKALVPYAVAFGDGSQPDPLLLDAIAVLGLILAICAYVVVSRILSVVLGAFPPMGKPLPPLRRLRVKARPVRPVVVTVKVPKLPRRRRKLRLVRGAP